MEFHLCEYKDLFGKPNTGLRKYRVFDIAILDTAVVIIIGFIISFFTRINIWIILGALFISGVFMHRIFCVRTGVDKMLFSE
jgi:hypothetical protein